MEKKPTFIYRDRVINEESYVEWLHELKSRYRQSQVKASVRVNTAMLEFYWSLGRDIVDMQAESKWGSGFFNQLSLDMKAEFPNEKGFSSANLRYMKRWYDFYYQRAIILQRPVEKLQEVKSQQHDDLSETPKKEGQIEIRQRVVEELEMPKFFGMIPWGQHIEIFTKCKTLDEALFYVSQTIENNWSRPEIEAHIAEGLFQNQGAAVTNFSDRLPSPQGDLAQELLKGEYNLEFLHLKKKHDEKELEEKIASNITQFLLQLGKGFAYVGRQMELQMPGGQTFFPDLVFYHIPQKRYMVIELKAVKFMPEHAGKLNFYVTAADRLLKGDDDNPSIGLLICRSMDKTLVEWSLADIQKPLGVATYQIQEVVDRTIKEMKLEQESKEEVE
jgi:predicted nuclease of restriction endonuclease-like (RecB) superfamily